MRPPDIRGFQKLRPGTSSRDLIRLRRRSIALRGTDATTRSNETIMTAVTQTRSDAAALKKVPMLIGGKWVESASGQVLEVEDPAHRRPIAEIPRGRVEDVARRHFPLGRA